MPAPRHAAALALAATLALPSAALHAARPLVTDDARTVDAHACQVESWIRTNRGNREYWALPACNFTGNLELTLGGALTADGTGTGTTDILFQGKTLFKPLETNGYGIGLAVGYAGRPGDNPGGKPLGNPYFYVPMSFSLKNDDIVLHANLGAQHSRGLEKTRPTWGLGTEIRVNQQLFLIAETFGQSDGRPSMQTGVRFWIVPNHVQVDTTYGNRLATGGERRWFSIGMRLLSLPFLK